MKFEIKNWITGKVNITLEGENWKLAFCAAVKAGQKFDQADLSEKDFSGIKLDCKDSSFDNSRFNNSSFNNSRFDNSSFDNSRFNNSRFNNSSFNNSRFDNSSFDNSRFNNSRFDNSRFNNSRFNNSRFNNSRFDNSRFDNSSFAYKKIIDQRPFFFIGPLGSDQRHLMAVHTEKGIHLQTGCFSGSIEEFTAAVKKKHAKNEHGKEYLAALVLIKLHFKL